MRWQLWQLCGRPGLAAREQLKLETTKTTRLRLKTGELWAGVEVVVGGGGLRLSVRVPVGNCEAWVGRRANTYTHTHLVPLLQLPVCLLSDGLFSALTVFCDK